MTVLKAARLGIVAVTVVATGGACTLSSDSGSDSTTSTSAATSSGTEGGSGTTTDESHRLFAAVPLLAMSSPTGKTSKTAALVGTSVSSSETDEVAKSYTEQKASLEARLNATDLSGCFAGIVLAAAETSVSCYGPALHYVSHPNFTAAGAVQNPPDCPINCVSCGCLPTGDLGIWTSTEAGSGEACASAKMNSLVTNVGSIINQNVELMVGMVCAANLQGKTLDAPGKSIDLVSVVEQYVAGADFETATLERIADQPDSRATYRITLKGDLSGIDVSTTLTHAANAENTEHAGRIHGYIDETNEGATTGSRKGFSVVYSEAKGTFKYVMRTASTPNTVSEVELFSDDLDYDYSVFASKGASLDYANAMYQLASIETATGLGTVYFAWQAGGFDNFTRVFHVTTAKDAANGVESGVGYFGFGPAITTESVGRIDGMWCNWAGPGNAKQSGTMNTTEVQAQTMVRDSASGYFVPSGDFILYAPTNSCSHSSPTFKYSTAADTLVELDALPATSVADELVPYESKGSIPDLAEPSF